MPEHEELTELPENVTDLSEHRGTPKRSDARRDGKREKVRMSGQQRREQLVSVGRTLFAEKGFEVVTVEEIAAKADVSKPVVYEHFGGKEGLYAVIVDREMSYLLQSLTDALADSDAGSDPRVLLEQAALALFDYIDKYPDGFRILLRDTPIGHGDVDSAKAGSFASVIVDVASQVEHLLARQFSAHKIDRKLSAMYSRMLVGMVALTGQWWVDVRKPKKEEVVAHLVNLAWYGLSRMEPKPSLKTKP